MTAASFTAFAENAGKWVLARFRRWGDVDLNGHHGGPGAIGFNPKNSNLIENFVVYLINGREH